MPCSARGRVPSYRLHRPSGCAVVTLDGRDIYLGEHDTDESRQAYDRLIAEWIANGRRLPGADDGLTIVEVIARYWPHVESYYRKDGHPTNEVATIRSALRPLKRLYGRTPAAEFGPLAIKTVRQAMIDQGWGRKHVNGQVSRIKAMFRWAVENELIPPSVHHGLSAVSGLRKGRSEARESTPVLPVPDALVDAVQPHASRQVWAMIELQRLSGMRPGEVTIMRGRDLDTTGRIWAYTPSSHKTEHHGHQRVVHLGPRAQRIILPFLRADLSAFLFSPADAEAERAARLRMNRKTRVQPSQRRRNEARRRRARRRPPLDHYTTDSYRRAIARACDLAGIDPWHPHQLRHNAATRLRKEHGIEAARVVLGHRSAAMTEVYAEIDQAKAVEIMAKVG